MGRATQGVRLINLEKLNDQIGSICKVDSEPVDEEIPEGGEETAPETAPEAPVTE
jgi:DNA gyrase subunit A